MPLKGVAPKTVKKRLKMFLFGMAKSGKSTLAVTFPKSYYIDTERGVENEQYIESLQIGESRLLQTSVLDEIIAEVTTLLSEDHPYRTLVIDSLTWAYNEELDRSAKTLATAEDPSGTAFARHKTLPDRKMKHLMNLLTRLDMNVIITSHSKMQYGEGMVKLGETYDCYAKMDYLFDLIIEVVSQGADSRYLLVRGSRCANLPKNAKLPATYDAVVDAYGRSQVERDCVPERLATPTQVAQLKLMIKSAGITASAVDGWLSKAKAVNLFELSQDQAQKCIESCAAKVATAVSATMTNPQPQTNEEQEND